MFSVFVSIGFGSNLSFQRLPLHFDFAGFQFGFSFRLGNVGIGRGHFDGLALFLFLNGVCRISFGGLGVRLLFQFGLTDFQAGLLFGNFLFGLHLCVVGFFFGSCLRNGNVTVSLRFGNGCGLFDLRDVVDTQIVDDAILVRKALNVERNQFQTHLLQVRDGVLLYAFTEGFAVGNHFGQFHLTNNFTHVAFQRVLYSSDNHFFLFIQEEAGCQCHHFVGLSDTDFDSGVNFDVDVFGVGDVICGFDIHREHFQGKTVNAFQKRNPNAGPANQNAGLSETGDDDGGIRGRFDVTHAENDQYEDNNHCNRKCLEKCGHLVSRSLCRFLVFESI